jgi:molybdopterin molybdotransferase
MDGYALALKGPSPGIITVSCESRIGQPPPDLAPKTAGKVFTGSPIPRGADVVIRREDVVERPGQIELSEAALRALTPGTHIRRRGENLAAGQSVIPAGLEITAPIAAALACFGVANPAVYKRVHVGILVTGDELVPIAQPLSDYQLRDSNGPSVAAALSRLQWLDVLPPRRCHDDPSAMRDAVTSLLAECDALILTGGVSMGDRDYVPATLSAIGAQTVFKRVPQRPGGPVMGAVTQDRRPILALPGNPVSVLVTCRRMAIPILAAQAGLRADPRPPTLVHVNNPDQRTLNMWWQRLSRLTAPGQVELLPTKGSGDIPSAARSDGFVEIPPNASGPGPWPFYSWSF